ncbi:MAG: PKD domain-containing protein [Deltaproteobacteria bacterium]|nr:PKD domain-containing protein [Deltaproteobacteria bacterium]
MKWRGLVFAALLAIAALAASPAGATVWGPDGGGYRADDEATFDWQSMSGATDTLANQDDEEYGPFPIGFTFSFYGQDFTEFYVSTNGYITFDATTSGHVTYNDFQTADYYDWIAVFAGDRAVYAGAPTNGLIEYKTVGSAPNRMLVVQFTNLWQSYDIEENLMDAQVILYETSNDILTQWDNMDISPYPGLVGIESTAGESWLTPSDYNRLWVNEGDAVLFTASGDLGVTSVNLEQSAGTAGRTFTHVLRVAEFGGVTATSATYDVAVTAGDWGADLSDDEITVPAGGYFDVEVEVDIPADAQLGDADTFEISITEQKSGAAKATRTFTTSASANAYDVEPLPDPMAYAPAVYHNGLVYLIGGIDIDSANQTDDVLVYDPEADSWDTADFSLPEPTDEHLAEVIDGVLYVPGKNSTETLWAYDFGSDSWDMGLAPMPTGFTDANNGDSAVWDGLLYIACADGDNKKLIAYDPDADSWDELADLPTSGLNGSMQLEAVDGFLYAFGGYDNDFDGGAPTGDVFVYDIADDSWDTIEGEQSFAREYGGGFAHNGKLYLLGGGDANYDYALPEVNVFDTATKAGWSVYPGRLPIDKYGFAFAVVPGKGAYLIGGYYDTIETDQDEVYLLPLCENPAPDFSADATEVEVGVDVTFTSDNPVGACSYTSITWDFGDTETGAGEDAVHAYAAAGTYTVTMTVETLGGEGMVEKVEYITVTEPSDDDTDDDADDDTGDDDAGGDDDTTPMDDDGGDDDDDDDGGCCGC